ncbi:PilN domain-containing protein [Pseudomonas entomophila]|uniref:Type IV pili biogenesis protein PilN n=2 Tax=Pseudomonas entomophila TaxID=312306 RepID=Q1IGB1_PSEE4|nr:PilN domain-containing protein [Pseudomonas entomophila]WMW05862.1 PilN domain-containing protein [Pseudomonas entomophila]CAK13291.1 type IV pili biogenesis protein PilN [Pseudomonas entomophila L48]
MRVRLNLMPWRELRRVAVVRQFRAVLMACLVMAVVAVMLLDEVMQSRVARQQAVNTALQRELEGVDTAMAQVEHLRASRNALLAQYMALSRLRGAQALLPALFSDLEMAMPEGARLHELDVQGSRVQLTGMAASASVVALLLRRMEQADVLQDLELVHLRHGAGGDEFVVTARLSASWS